jgi:hypothetical protein
MSKFKLGDRVRAANPLWDATEEEKEEVWRIVSLPYSDSDFTTSEVFLVENAQGRTGVMAEVEMERVTD